MPFFLHICEKNSDFAPLFDSNTYYNMKKTLILMLAVAFVACTSKLPKLEDECVYNPSKTSFAFWSNAAEQMEVRIYNDANGDASLNDANDVQTVSLKKGPMTSGQLPSKAIWRVSSTPSARSRMANGHPKRRVSSPRLSRSTDNVPRSLTSTRPTPKDGNTTHGRK